MRMKDIVVIALALAAVTPAYAQQLMTDEDVRAAIDVGRNGKAQSIAKTAGMPGRAGSLLGGAFADALAEKNGVRTNLTEDYKGSFDVVIVGPSNRIALLAATAKRDLKPFDESNVTEDMRQRYIVVTASPQKPVISSQRISRTPLPTNVVMRMSHGKNAEPSIVQPAKTDRFPAEWQNLVGAKFQGEGMVALFAIGDVPSSDFELVVTTEEGERIAKVGVKELSKLR